MLPASIRFTRLASPHALAGATLLLLMSLLAGCGGNADPPEPTSNVPVTPQPPPSVATPPTLSPVADQTVQLGQTATFTVSATGTAPLTYQWSENGTEISGATGASVTTAATIATDNGAKFSVVVANSAGTVTSNQATLTVISPPVLTITEQPVSVTVASGATATFTANATCTGGAVTWQWQRSADGTTFVSIAAATSPSYSLMTALTDNAAEFRATASCGNLTQNTSVATLTVTSPPPVTSPGVTLAPLPIVGLRDQADIRQLAGIDADAAGSFTFTMATRVKRLSADLSTITAVAGGALAGSADGPAASASFNFPAGLAHDTVGNIYVADSGNFTIRRITPDGTVSTIAGLAGSSGTTDGTGAAARFSITAGIAMGPDGDLYVTERDTGLVRRVTTAGVVSTYAGSTPGYAEGAASMAQFDGPAGIVVAANGDVIVADLANNRVRRVVRAGNAAGMVETLAGGAPYSNPETDGTGAAAYLNNPVALSLAANILTVREGSGYVRHIDLTTAVVTTVVSRDFNSASVGYIDGPATQSQVSSSGGMAPMADGGVMLADESALRSMTSAGFVQTIAYASPRNVTDEGVGVLAQIPFCLESTGLGSNVSLQIIQNQVVVADGCSNVVRSISLVDGTVKLVAGLFGGGGGLFPNDEGAPIYGQGSAAQFIDVGPAMTSDSSGNLYVGNFASVRKIDVNDVVTPIAGSPFDQAAVNANGAAARFSSVDGLAVAPNGNLIVGDYMNNAIRSIDAAGNVTTYVGVFGQPQSVDGPIGAARVQLPQHMEFAPNGALYFADASATSPTSGAEVRQISSDGTTVSSLGVHTTGTFTIDPAGTLYYGDDAGLFMLPAGVATPTLLIPFVADNGVTGATNVFGTNPKLVDIKALASIGPKQVLIVSESQLVVATLP